MTKLSTTETNRAVGRRKRASARVRISKGTGKITINGVDFKTFLPYFQSPLYQSVANSRYV